MRISFKDTLEKKEPLNEDKSVEQKAFEDQFSELINKLRDFEKYAKTIEGSNDVLSLCNKFRNELLQSAGKLSKTIQ